MRILEYNRQKVVEYAEKWAYRRNPKYYNFDSVGGDCTSFVSQCIYEGSKVMNYNKNLGWYYNSGNDKSPSWSGVEFLHNFLVKNKSVGPFGKIVDIHNIQIGDIAQLSFNGSTFGHSLLIVDKKQSDVEHILVATHTFDSYGRRISTYNYEAIRFIHIEGVRNW